MKILALNPDSLIMSSDLSRSSCSKQFEERLKASIREIGLVEPLKVAPLPEGKYLVVDGLMRLRAINEIRRRDTSMFATIAAYVVEYSQRFEIRYQTDIYQDLLPSQLAVLVEHLHSSEQVRKVDIARFIGVSPSTLRNYTGLWRLLSRGGLFAKIVDLMDVGIIPSSNPYAWLRLKPDGLRYALENGFGDGERAEVWIARRVGRARRGDVAPFRIDFVEAVTNALPADYYREPEEVRTLKRDLGLRRARARMPVTVQDAAKAIRNLKRVSRGSPDPILQSAARSLLAYLQ